MATYTREGEIYDAEDEPIYDEPDEYYMDDVEENDYIVEDDDELSEYDEPRSLSAKDANGIPIIKGSRVKVISTINSRPYTVTDGMTEIYESGDICIIKEVTDERHVNFNGWCWHPKDLVVVTKPKNYKKPEPVSFDISTLDV